VAVDIRAIGICGTDFPSSRARIPSSPIPYHGSRLSAWSPAVRRLSLAPGTTGRHQPYFSCGHCVACRKNKPNCCATLKVLGVHIDGGYCGHPGTRGHSTGAGPQPSRCGDDRVQAIGPCRPPERTEVGDRARSWYRADRVGTDLRASPAGPSRSWTSPRGGSPRSPIRFGFRRIKAGGGRCRDRPTGGDRCDIVFDATGSAGDGGLAFVASGGTLVFVGVRNADITFNDPELHRKEMTEGDAERHPRRFRDGDGRGPPARCRWTRSTPTPARSTTCPN
jgi:hypothetical protein